MVEGPALAPLDSRVSLVCFELGAQEYAVDVSWVQEIIRLPEITRVPRAPDFVEGVVNLRGRILPVVDLRKRLALPCEPLGRKARIVIARLGGVPTAALQAPAAAATRAPAARATPFMVGLIVDQVTEVLRLSAAAVEPAPELVLKCLDNSFIRGVGRQSDRLLIVLDLERIFRRTEVEALTAPLTP